MKLILTVCLLFLSLQANASKVLLHEEMSFSDEFDRFQKLTPINGEVSEFRTDETQDFTKIMFFNKCYRTIYAALHFYSLDGNWETAGWFQLAPGQQGYIQDTRNRFYYIYAQSTEDHTWSGAHHFEVASDGEFGFIKKRINLDSWGSWIQTFSCN